MRRYLRCPGAICCPAPPRALQAVLQPHIRFCDELIADALSPLPRGCGASAHQLAAADAPWAASLADAFGCDTVALVLFPEAAAPASASPALQFALALIGIDQTITGVASKPERADLSASDRHRSRASPRSPNGPT